MPPGHIFNGLSKIPLLSREKCQDSGTQKLIRFHKGKDYKHHIQYTLCIQNSDKYWLGSITRDQEPFCRPRLDDIQAKNGNRLGAAALAGAHRNGTHEGVRFGGGAIQRTGIEVQPDFDSDTLNNCSAYWRGRSTPWCRTSSIATHNISQRVLI